MTSHVWPWLQKIFILWCLSLYCPISSARAEEGNNAAAGKEIVALIFGDSITAGLGLAAEEAFPALTETMLRAKGINVTVINAGVSGDTTGGGLNRLLWTLDNYHPDITVMELGANDMLRGLDPSVPRANLDAMLNLLNQRGIPVILTSVTASPHLGAPYQEAFNKIYPELAAKYRTPLYPFLLNDTFGKPGLMQEDGVHPSAAGAKVIAEKMAAYLEVILRKK